jgi:isopentenyl-diphosphate delta-isomerase
MQKNGTTFVDNDATAESRKQDHIELAFKSQVPKRSLDERFYYEPVLAAHPSEGLPEQTFLGKSFRTPLWVSSMTGGTAYANTINHNLARVARDFGFGMGLGSCRSLLTSDEYLPDFNVRAILGDAQPLYANLGIAQLEQLLENGQLDLIHRMLGNLSADGLIIHINPMQEWLQPEGDRFLKSPLDTIEQLLEAMPGISFIVKEVGQGMGYESLKALLKLPIAAVDFAANGGTNFAKLELLRSTDAKREVYEKLVHLGHSAEEMVLMTNQLVKELGVDRACNEIIISGGVSDFLDGYYLTQKLDLPAVYGQASALLRHARGKYEDLYQYVEAQVEGLQLANSFLTVK